MKKKILIDLDDTILMDSWKEFTEEYLGETIDVESLAPGTYVNSGLTSPSFIDYFMTHDLYDYGTLDQKVIDFIEILSKTYDVYIASMFVIPGIPSVSSIFAKRKVDFLSKRFSFLGEDKFLILGSKSILDADISIGDSLSDQIGKEKNFLLTRYHNKHISDEELSNRNSIRMDNWEELITYFKEHEF